MIFDDVPFESERFIGENRTPSVEELKQVWARISQNAALMNTLKACGNPDRADVFKDYTDNDFDQQFLKAMWILTEATK